MRNDVYWRRGVHHFNVTSDYEMNNFRFHLQFRFGWNPIHWDTYKTNCQGFENTTVGFIISKQENFVNWCNWSALGELFTFLQKSRCNILIRYYLPVHIGGVHIQTTHFFIPPALASTSLMAHTHCTGPGTGRGQGPGWTPGCYLSMFMSLCNVYSTWS